MEVVGIRTPGRGDTSDLMHHDGAEVLVDPQRDVERFLAVGGDQGTAVRFVLERHAFRPVGVADGGVDDLLAQLTPAGR